MEDKMTNEPTKENVKGFKDFSGEEALKREAIKKLLIEKFKTYGFMPAETPIIEFEEFVKGNSGNGDQSDEAISDIFRLKDRGERELALRYEFTFQLKRLAIGKKLPFRRYQIGEVFRDEPVSSNRFRQFTQCDVDIIGSTIKDTQENQGFSGRPKSYGILCEAEVLKVFSEILKELKIDAVITINNRKLLNEIIESEGIKDNFAKEQIIREIDKLDKLSEDEVKANLVKYNADKIISILKKPEKYFEKYESFKEIQELKKFCLMFGFKPEFSPFLARGLSYYNGSVFEIQVKGIKEKIAGGGSYLVNGIQGTGISFGLERLTNLAKIELEGVKCLIISLGQDKEAIKLAQELREENISCFVMDKLSKALDYANQEKIAFAIFVGKEELKKKKFKLRNMKTGKEEFLTEKELLKKFS